MTVRFSDDLDTLQRSPGGVAGCQPCHRPSASAVSLGHMEEELPWATHKLHSHGRQPMSFTRSQRSAQVCGGRIQGRPGCRAEGRSAVESGRVGSPLRAWLSPRTLSRVSRLVSVPSESLHLSHSVPSSLDDVSAACFWVTRSSQQAEGRSPRRARCRTRSPPNL